MNDKIALPQHVFTTRQNPINFERTAENKSNNEMSLANNTNERNQTFHWKSKEQVEEMVKGLNDFLNPVQTSLKFEFHEKLNEYYVTVVDDTTKEVIKEIPPKKMLDLYAAMAEMLGVIVDKKI
ncbi:flagellar protein FlaG [Bacillus kwashiorkori]|uniref:flagellar protein FlaG n=1 Tax=Bacillus kwashiorkori TaxID=1522318 RepID=UPI0008F8A1D0|nr:flagellar protein FlaG [Bacillus kwashiorkori]